MMVLDPVYLRYVISYQVYISITYSLIKLVPTRQL
jgi:hypothetical protein